MGRGPAGERGAAPVTGEGGGGPLDYARGPFQGSRAEWSPGPLGEGPSLPVGIALHDGPNVAHPEEIVHGVRVGVEGSPGRVGWCQDRRLELAGPPLPALDAALAGLVGLRLCGEWAAAPPGAGGLPMAAQLERAVPLTEPHEVLRRRVGPPQGNEVPQEPGPVPVPEAFPAAVSPSDDPARDACGPWGRPETRLHGDYAVRHECQPCKNM